MPAEPLVRGVLVPGTVAALALCAAWWRADDRRHRAGAVAVGLGYAAGHAALVGWPPLPPIEATDWLLVLGLAVALAAFASGPDGEGAAGRRARQAAFACATPALVLWPIVQNAWSALESALWLGGAAAALLALLALVERATATGGVERCVPLALAAAGGSAVVVASGSALVGQLGGALAAAIGARLLAGCARPRRPVVGAAFACGVLFGAILLCGLAYVRMPLASALLVAGGPAAALSLQAGPLARWPPWKSAGLAALLVLAAAGAAFAVAWTSVERYGDHG